MKYLKLVAFLLLILTSQKVNAESYIVDTPVLNVRSCAGTNCKIIGKLVEGDSVVSIKDDGEWVEIKTENGSGYVIKKALSEDNWKGLHYGLENRGKCINLLERKLP